MTFCETFEDQRNGYQEALDSPDGVRLTDLSEAYREWADALKIAAPPEVAEDVATFTSPIYMTESGTVNLVEVFNAGNDLAVHCIANG